MTVLFDTTPLERSDRAEYWFEAHRRAFFPIAAEFASPDATHGRLEANRLGPLAIYRVVSDPSVVVRSGAAIRSSDPEEFLLGMLVRGDSVIEQSARSTRFAGGDLSSWDSSHPFFVSHGAAFDLLLLVMPRTLLGPGRDRIFGQTAGRIAHDSEMGAITGTCLRQVWSALDHGTAADPDDLADALIALVRALHPATRPEGPAPGLVPAAAMVPRIKAYMREHLGDPALGPEAVARAHYISTRYLHKLFAREGLTVSEWIRHRRLEACRRDLRDPALAHENVSQIARRWGLPNPSSFSRMFREAYGCAPSDLRPAPR
jgi:AraC-like DNA-binding protein